MSSPLDPVALPEKPPRSIGRFIVFDTIGQGNHGIVYAAHDTVLEREVAIKAVQLTDLGGQPSLSTNNSVTQSNQNIQTFLTEAKLAAKLNHPSIVTIFDAGLFQRYAYIAMERLHGQDMHQFLHETSKRDLRKMLTIILQVIDALQHAHERGLIHRDIKPSNIFLLKDMRVKLLDFGIATAKPNKPSANQEFLGTPNYVSPEQASNKPLDARSDIFSVGCILYELVTGMRAFDGKSWEDVLVKVFTWNPPEAHTVNATIPESLSKILNKAIAKNPNERFASTRLMKEALIGFAQQAFHH